MRYRKRWLKVTSLTDPIHLKSRIAVLAMVRAMKYMAEGKIKEGDAMEMKALQYLTEEKLAKSPNSSFSIQFDTSTGMGSPEHGQY
jgi:hypothetical protein